jgi:hypothetical protein
LREIVQRQQKRERRCGESRWDRLRLCRV